MPFFRIVDCQTFFAEYFCHMVVLLNIILRNGKLPNGKIAEGCCGMTYTRKIMNATVKFLNLIIETFCQLVSSLLMIEMLHAS